MAKAKFIYITDTKDGSKKRIQIKDNTFKYPDGTQFFNIQDFSTDDLLKVKAQIATELENRMDYDDVVEANLVNLKAKISSAESKVIAELIRQTLDRLDTVSADEKRAKTRLEILQDEMKLRLQQDGVDEAKFAGLISVSNKAETVYSVGELGWDTVYEAIVDKAIEAREKGQSVVDAFSIIQKRLTSTTLNELVKQGEELPKGIEAQVIRKVKVRRIK